MSRPPWKGAKSKPWLICTTSTPHGVALVRSGPERDPNLYATLKDLCGDTPPQRSAAGGWVVSLDVLEDLRCLAQHRGLYIVARERKER